MVVSTGRPGNRGRTPAPSPCSRSAATGAGELCPYSDLDVVLVHDGHRNVGAMADAIWYPVWDEGVHLDHSVRRPAEVLAAAEGDLRVALGLLDARLVWGEHRGRGSAAIPDRIVVAFGARRNNGSRRWPNRCESATGSKVTSPSCSSPI